MRANDRKLRFLRLPPIKRSGSDMLTLNTLPHPPQRQGLVLACTWEWHTGHVATTGVGSTTYPAPPPPAGAAPPGAATAADGGVASMEGGARIFCPHGHAKMGAPGGGWSLRWHATHITAFTTCGCGCGCGVGTGRYAGCCCRRCCCGGGGVAVAAYAGAPRAATPGAAYVGGVAPYAGGADE